MADFEKAREELLGLDPRGGESIEEFSAKIFEILVVNGIYSDYEWQCQSSYVGGEG